jgi:hypothetical protein
MKPKTCKSCKQKFTPARPLQACCGINCAIAHANKLKLKNNALEAKKTRKAYTDTKNKLKSLTEHLHEAQRHFNLWIRMRDERKPCISCGRVSGCQFHAGHYRTTKAAPQLRFNEDNCSKQCAQCNNHLSGNITEYRIELVKRIGVERVEALENNNELHRYTIDEAKEIKRVYREKIRLMKGIK